MYLKKCEMICLSCLFAAGVACGTDVATETFEVNTWDNLTTGESPIWAGYGTIVDTTENVYTDPNGVGYPVTGNHTKALQVDGYVTLTPTTATPASEPLVQVDVMVLAALPDEALAFPTGETEGTDPIQIAVGVDQKKNGETVVADKGVLKVFCKGKTDTTKSDWCTLMDVTKDQWYRVSFVFDYNKSMCQVRVDGSPVVTVDGYLTSDSTKTDGNGSWYALNTTDKKQLKSVKVIGTTSLDDVVISSSAASSDGTLPVLPGDTTATVPAQTSGTEGGTMVNIPVSWFANNGIQIPAKTEGSVGVALAPDESGMTLAAKYETGISPTDGSKFELKTMTMADGTQTGTAKATFEIPTMTPPTGKKVVLVYAANSKFMSDKREVDLTTTDLSSKKVTVDNISGSIIYYRLETRDNDIITK